ncbi:MAG: ABC transporter substrate binding protein [Peptoanaerobacter stomatis]|uniref:ABC transporter substrate-binding protein n=1 Tax=Peptoanaerobacter stomatis TaxID=796937 RepID=UPI003FA07F28
MKKLMSMILISSLLLTVGCSSSDNSEKKEGDVKKYKIGITQLIEHPALDDARKGFEEELKAKGIDAEIIYKNAQGDVATATTIAQGFTDEKVDLIYSISTTSTQAAKQVTNNIPIVFSAVTDPVKSELEGENITGVSDKTPIKEQLELFNKLQDGIKKIGIIYSTSETNSQIQIADAKEASKEIGLEIVDIGINNINDMPQAIDALIGKCDGVYVITDNLVAKSLDLLTSKVNSAKKVLIMSYVDSSTSSQNVLLANGVSYVDFGKQAGDMAAKILLEGVKPSSIPVGYADRTYNTVSMKIVKDLGLDENNPIIKEAQKIE